MRRMSGTRVGVDVGGTFTDLVALVDGRVVTWKVPSTRRDQAAAVVHALESAGLEKADVAEIRHGTTVATNALLERRGARTALVTTAGFRDVLEIGRQNRPSLYDLAEDRPPPLVPRELRFTVRERTGPDGVLEPLDEASVRDAVARLGDADADAVAVCLLFAYLHPEHERRVGELVREALPRAHVALSSDVLPEFREYERFATTTATAYLAPLLAGYLRGLSGRLADAGFPAPLVMQSSGGVVSADEAAARAGAAVLSGPAGGAVGAAHVARLAGYPDALTLDMGGTSADVALVRGGAVATTTETVVAGVPLKLPAVDVHTVSAGGGSVAWVDEGGALRVGPRSAGAEPGPAAYGRGGEQATVTDASLVLGRLPAGARLGGEVTLDGKAAEAAVARVASSAGIGVEDAALGILRVANAEMAGALRVMSVERGIDPRDLGLVAFGGAGPMHACALAEELGMKAVLVPRASGVLSALGLALSELRRDGVAPFRAPLADVEDAELERRFRALEAATAAGLDGARVERRADLRYRAQGFELTVAAGDLEALAQRFHATHEERYGYRMEHVAVELVSIRAAAIVAADPPALEPVGPRGEALRKQEPDRYLRAPRRQVNLGGGWADVPVLRDAASVEGPAIVELPEATCVVHEGWAGSVDDAGMLVLERR
jgi:N-methylhydantoinase A